MRIIHEIKYDHAIRRIAQEMINIEYNKIVYKDLKLQSYPWDPYVSSGVNGVHFYVQANVGYICVPSINNIQKFHERLITETEILDKQLDKYPSKLIVMNPEDTSTIGSTHYGEYKKCMLHRIIYDATPFQYPKIIPETYFNVNEADIMYTWYMSSYEDIILIRDHIDTTNINTKNTSMINLLLKAASCIVYDPMKIFNFADDHIQLNFPIMENFTCSPYYEDSFFDIHIIYGIRWHIYKRRNADVTNCFELKCAVYEEQFDKIKLYAYDYEDEKSPHVMLTSLLLQKIYECSINLIHPVTHKRRSMSLKTSPRNDICNVCQTLLYDDIYVIEIITYERTMLVTYMGLCAICVHSYNDLFEDLTKGIKNQITIRLLKVRYPRTFMETLTLLNYSTKCKRIMNNIYTKTLHFDGTILLGDNIVSVRNPYDLLKKLYKDTSYIFNYKLIYQTKTLSTYLKLK